MLPAMWIFFGVMVALTVVPVAITISDVLKFRKDNKGIAGNGQRNTHSSLRPQDVSKGIHVAQYGFGEHHREWSGQRSPSKNRIGTQRQNSLRIRDAPCTVPSMNTPDRLAVAR
jgi:hypothetical protein